MQDVTMNLRIAPVLREAIRVAASMRHQTIIDFVTSAVEQELRKQRLVPITVSGSPQDREEILAWLDSYGEVILLADVDGGVLLKLKPDDSGSGSLAQWWREKRS